MTFHSLCTTLPLKELPSTYSCILCILNAFINLFIFCWGMWQTSKTQPAIMLVQLLHSPLQSEAADPLSHYHIPSLCLFSVQCAHPSFRVIKTSWESSANWVVNPRSRDRSAEKAPFPPNVLRETVTPTVTSGLYCSPQIWFMSLMRRADANFHPRV